jgi:hypothetical protein
MMGCSLLCFAFAFTIKSKQAVAFDRAKAQGEIKKMLKSISNIKSPNALAELQRESQLVVKDLDQVHAGAESQREDSRSKSLAVKKTAQVRKQIETLQAKLRNARSPEDLIAARWYGERMQHNLLQAIHASQPTKKQDVLFDGISLATVGILVLCYASLCMPKPSNRLYEDGGVTCEYELGSLVSDGNVGEEDLQSDRKHTPQVSVSKPHRSHPLQHRAITIALSFPPSAPQSN